MNDLTVQFYRRLSDKELQGIMLRMANQCATAETDFAREVARNLYWAADAVMRERRGR